MNKKIYKTIKILFLSTVFALLAPANGYALPGEDEEGISKWISKSDTATWGNGNNWTNDTVPGPGATVVIPDNSVLSLSGIVEVGKILLGTNVRINSSANDTLKAGKVKIDFIVEKAHEWYSIGFPFQIDSIYAETWEAYLMPADTTANGTYGTTGNFWLEEYNGDNNKFVPVTTFPLKAKKGYIIQFPEASEGAEGYENTRITFISNTVNYADTVIEATNDSYQLLANPTLGSYSLTPTANDKSYYTYFGGDDNKYKLVAANDEAVLKPFEAAITVGTTVGAKRSSIGPGSNGLTGIEGATIETNDPVIATRYYTVQGAEIKQPSGNGIYIVRKIHASQKEDVSKIIYIKK